MATVSPRPALTSSCVPDDEKVAKLPASKPALSTATPHEDSGGDVGSGGGGGGGAVAGHHRAAQMRNTLRAAQHAVGCAIKLGRWGKYEGESIGAAVLAYLNPKFGEWRADGT